MPRFSLSVRFGLDILIPLNQDTMNRHLTLMKQGSSVLYNKDKIKPGAVADGVQLCGFSVKELAPQIRGDLVRKHDCSGRGPALD